MPRFRKKPVVIEAFEYTGASNSEAEAADWAGVSLGVESRNGVVGLIIPTLEGDHFASPGDWLIRGVKGEIYPCKPDIFAATYDAVD